MASKLCVKCSKSFVRKVKYSDSQWNKAIFCSKSCSASVTAKKRLGKALSEAHRKAISNSIKGKKKVFTQQHKDNIKKSFTDEMRQNLAKLRTGERNIFWKGGVTSENLKIRMMSEYRIWRNHVYQRDNFTCQDCGVVGGKLNAHHIKEFSNYPELRFDLSNGQTLCISCHRKTENFGKKSLNLIK